MVICSPLAGMVGNIVGLKWVLVLGTLGYVPYSAALYCNSAFGTQWFLLFGAATCGISASALWTAESAIGVGYPEPARRGLYISIWLTLNQLGSVIGSCILLGMSVGKDVKGGISPNVYLVLVGLQCLGLPLSLLISPADKLIRTDGQKPVLTARKRTLKSELKAFWKICTTKRIALLVPIFISVQWGQTYQGNYLAKYFTVEARALAGFLIAVVGMIVSLIFGWMLDLTVLRRSQRAKVSWVFLVAIFIGIWIYNLVVQVHYSKTHPTIDIHSHEFSRAVGVYILFRIGYQAGSLWVYWILGTFNVEVDNLALTTGLLRAGESLGSAFSYTVGAVKAASLLTNLIVAVVVFMASVPPTTWAAWLVTDDKTVGDLEEEVEGEEVTIEAPKSDLSEKTRDSDRGDSDRIEVGE
ncbi:MAG: hypothetical protein M1819_006127 [Sarea resinae]|nr:MAG: hypothetical protein M1819_006127 [Sarea resinae]